MPLTTVADFAAGDKTGVAAKLTAVKDNVEAINGFVLKTADESVASSTVFQDDNHLVYTIAAAGTYVVDVWLLASSEANNAGDLLWAFDFPTGTMYGFQIAPDNGLVSGAIQTTEWRGGSLTSGAETNQGIGLSTITNTSLIHGVLVATATGTLKFQWRQRSSNVNASTIHAGSHMLVRQVA